MCFHIVHIISFECRCYKLVVLSVCIMDENKRKCVSNIFDHTGNTMCKLTIHLTVYMWVSWKTVVSFSNILATQLYVWDYIWQEYVFQLVDAYDGIFPCQNIENRRDMDHKNVWTTEHFIGISSFFFMLKYILLIFNKRACLCNFFYSYLIIL